MSKQYDNLKITKWRGFRLLIGANHTNESKASKRHNVLRIFTSVSALPVRLGSLIINSIFHTIYWNELKLFNSCFITVQENSENPALVGATLETLLRFLNWIPLGYIFETELIPLLITKVIILSVIFVAVFSSSNIRFVRYFQFLNVPMFRNVTLKCLTEIAGVTVTNYDDMFILLFTRTMMTLEEVMYANSRGKIYLSYCLRELVEFETKRNINSSFLKFLVVCKISISTLCQMF